MDSTDPIGVVLTTAANGQEARLIANALVEERLAACVNIIGGVTSVYRWEGAIQEDSELLLVAKTRQSRYEDVRVRIRELHSYDVPEVIALDISSVDPAYLTFVCDETDPA